MDLGRLVTRLEVDAEDFNRKLLQAERNLTSFNRRATAIPAIPLPISRQPMNVAMQSLHSAVQLNTLATMRGGMGRGGARQQPRTGRWWDWQSSALGGMGSGLLFGGRMAPIVGSMGAGIVGGPAGIAAGIGLAGVTKGIEVAIGAVTAAFNKMLEVGTAVFSKLLDFGTQLVETIFELGMEAERSRASLEAMTGDIATGQKMFEDIRTLAVRTPYTSGPLMVQAERILGAGIEAESVLPVLERLGEIAAGDTHKLGLLVKAYSDVMSATRLMGQELRQFTNQGVGVKDFADTMGVSTKELRELMRKGEVPADVVTETINRLTSTGGRFHGRTERVMGTVFGQMAQLRERAEIAGANAGEAFFKKFGLAGRLSGLVDMLSPLQTMIEPIVDRVVGWLGRAEGTMTRVVDLAGMLGILFYKAFEGMEPLVPSWEQIERLLDRITGTVLPILLAGFQEVLRISLRFIAINISGIGKMLELTQKFINSPLADMMMMTAPGILPHMLAARKMFNEGGAMWDMTAGESLPDSLRTLSDKLFEQARVVGSTNWDVLAGDALGSFRKFRENLTTAVPATRGALLGGAGAAAMASQRNLFGKIPLGGGPEGLEPPEKSGVQAPKDLLNLGDQIAQGAKAAMSPMERYNNTLAQLKEGFTGMRMQGLTGLQMFEPTLTQQQYDLGMTQAINQLSQDLMRNTQQNAQVSNAALNRSTEAQEIINRSSMQAATAQEQVLKTLRDDLELQRKQVTQQREIITALREKDKGTKKRFYGF